MITDPKIEQMENGGRQGRSCTVIGMYGKECKVSGEGREWFLEAPFLHGSLGRVGPSLKAETPLWSWRANTCASTATTRTTSRRFHRRDREASALAPTLQLARLCTAAGLFRQTARNDTKYSLRILRREPRRRRLSGYGDEWPMPEAVPSSVGGSVRADEETVTVVAYHVVRCHRVAGLQIPVRSNSATIELSSLAPARPIHGPGDHTKPSGATARSPQPPIAAATGNLRSR